MKGSLDEIEIGCNNEYHDFYRIFGEQPFDEEEAERSPCSQSDRWSCTDEVSSQESPIDLHYFDRNNEMDTPSPCPHGSTFPCEFCVLDSIHEQPSTEDVELLAQNIKMGINEMIETEMQHLCTVQAPSVPRKGPGRPSMNGGRIGTGARYRDKMRKSREQIRNVSNEVSKILAPVSPREEKLRDLKAALAGLSQKRKNSKPRTTIRAVSESEQRERNRVYQSTYRQSEKRKKQIFNSIIDMIERGVFPFESYHQWEVSRVRQAFHYLWSLHCLFDNREM